MVNEPICHDQTENVSRFELQSVYIRPTPWNLQSKIVKDRSQLLRGRFSNDKRLINGEGVRYNIERQEVEKEEEQYSQD